MISCLHARIKTKKRRSAHIHLITINKIHTEEKEDHLIHKHKNIGNLLMTINQSLGDDGYKSELLSERYHT